MALTDAERSFMSDAREHGYSDDEIIAQVKKSRGIPVEAPVGMRGPGATDPDEGKTEIPTVPVPKTPLDAVKDTATSAAKAGLAAVDLASPISKTGELQAMFGQLAEPSYRREIERGVSNVVTGGLAEKIANKLSPEFAASAGDDAKAAPEAKNLGEVAGSFLPSPANYIAREAVPVASAIGSRLVGAGRSAAEKVGEGAVARELGRTAESLEEKVTKKTRAGLRADSTEGFIEKHQPELAEVRGSDEKLAPVIRDIKAQATEKTREIYKEAAARGSVPITSVRDNLNKRIDELSAGTSESREIAEKLKSIRDELWNSKKGADMTPMELRGEQSAYQKKGWGSNVTGEPARTAEIAANMEASKAVGESLVKHVTGMSYEAAKLASETDPSSLAGRLFEANADITGANRIEAGITDRSSRIKPKTGLKKLAQELRHPVGFALSLAPEAAAKGAEIADKQLSKLAGIIHSGARPTPLEISEATKAGVSAATIHALMSRLPSDETQN